MTNDETTSGRFARNPFRHSSFVIRHFLFVLSVLPALAAEPFFKPGDVLALIGGEDLVVASELGFFELLLQRALPAHRLKLRSLAWEGDTVFEQRRDLNFPTWEEQLAQLGATVVICQFGQMESLAGRAKLPDFVEAYAKLLARWSDGGKRRLLVLEPISFAEEQAPALRERNEVLAEFSAAARNVAERAGAAWAAVGQVSLRGGPVHRDGCHLTRGAHAVFALALARSLQLDAPVSGTPSQTHTELLKAIAARNRLWFDYWRVQNWAFLAGDRTVQPSSRDHRDPSKRWFPAEREEFLPLVAAKEKEIWQLASELAKP